jgi:hypothetical protein
MSGADAALAALLALFAPAPPPDQVVATKQNDPGTERPLHKDGRWTLAADGGACSAILAIEGGRTLILTGLKGGAEIMVGAGSDAGFKRGRKGRFETEAYSRNFTPVYQGEDYLQLDAVLDGPARLALRRARSVRITVDGRQEVRVDLERSGLPDVLASLQACAGGKAGWWGEGATVR